MGNIFKAFRYTSIFFTNFSREMSFCDCDTRVTISYLFMCSLNLIFIEHISKKVTKSDYRSTYCVK